MMENNANFNDHADKTINMPTACSAYYQSLN